MTIDIKMHGSNYDCSQNGDICPYINIDTCAEDVCEDAKALIIGMYEQIKDMKPCILCKNVLECTKVQSNDKTEWNTFNVCQHSASFKGLWEYKGVERDEMR